MNNSDRHPHTPVLIEEVLSGILTNTNGVYLDSTIGFGGHSSELLNSLDEDAVLIGIDYDPYALEYSRKRLSNHKKRINLFLSNYNEIKKIVKSLNVEYLDGVLFDLGVSSHQVDSGHKGLSYRVDSPLNMKMDNSGHSLKEFLNNSSEKDIANTIYKFGEERASRRISKSICNYRKVNKMNTNKDLIESIRKVIPERHLNKTLSRVFQAFRIKMNNELNNICKSIIDAIDLLRPGGRIAVITFHSIEDRLVKNIFRSFSKGSNGYLENIGYNIPTIEKASLILINKKTISPNKEEVLRNKRARSAKLRVAERI
tara:strand:+ start:101 stop:1042 length:942 start_codon:yes stop_codon:yes gene_type:complete